MKLDKLAVAVGAAAIWLSLSFGQATAQDKRVRVNMPGAFPGTMALPEGKATLKTEFTPDGSKEGGGTLKLFVNGRPAGEGKVKRSNFRHGLEPFEVGRDSITPIDPAYQDQGKFEFTGTIESITFDVKP